ncbi:MAG: BlaI/MecI/CopY family transcriptional regulator, partial [Bacteroidota bacterium]
ILMDKQFVDREKIGNMYRFFPTISKDDYQTEAVDDLLEKFFDNSYTKMIAHFANREKISEAELKDILNLIRKKK